MTWDEVTEELSPIKVSALLAPCFSPVYRAARSGEYHELWLSGGRGSGKSSFVSLFIVLGMMRDAEANAIVYRKVAETLRDSVYSQMIWAVETLGVGHLWRYGLSPMELCYRPTGQRILFRGTDKPEKSKGIKLRKGIFKFLWFEELAEFGGMHETRVIKASVLRGATGKRVPSGIGGEGMRGGRFRPQTEMGRENGASGERGHGTPQKELNRTFEGYENGTKSPITFYTYNPPMNAMHWVNAERMNPRKGRLYHHSDYRDMPTHWLGNGFLLEADALRQSNMMAYRHMYLGEVTGTGGRVFENLSIRNITQEEWGGLTLYCGHDFGFATDPDACVKCAYDHKRRTLYLVGEFVRTGMSLSALADELRGLCGGEVITADSSDPRGIAELRALGMRVIPARKGPGSVERGMKWLQTLASIVIDPAQCPYAAGEFQRYEYEPDGQGGFVPRYPDHGNHTIDAVRYAMESVSGRRVAMAVR